MTLRQAIMQVQEIGERHGFTIAVVGGALVRLIGEKTTISKIDNNSKTIFIKNALNPGVSREEDPATTVDIDAIAFLSSSPEENRELPKIKTEFRDLLKELKNAPLATPISLEPVLYHPLWPKPHVLTQFVSSIECHPSGQFLFRLGSVSQEIKKDSLRMWTYVFEETGEKMMSLMPPAIQMRYAIRGFGPKPKDVEKIWGEKSPFAKFVKSFNTQTKDAYMPLLTDWEEFSKKAKDFN